MAGSLANGMETEILKWLLTGEVVNRPASWYLGLFVDGNGQEGDQPSVEADNTTCPGYIRQPATFGVIGSVATSSNAQLFTATGDWAPVYCFGVWDAETGGNLITWGTISTKTLSNTDQLKFDVGQVSVSLD